MLHSTFELITPVASNSLVVFCFCNLIIAILLVVSSLPSSEIDDDGKPTTDSLPRISCRKENGNKRVDNYPSFEKNASSAGTTESSPQMQVAASAEEVIEASSINIALFDNSQESQDEEYDELRRRVEEFIEKVNRGWKAENLRTNTLGTNAERIY